MIRRLLAARIRAAHDDWTQARNAWHAVSGTPLDYDGHVYLARTRRRLDRWEMIYRMLFNPREK